MQDFSVGEIFIYLLFATRWTVLLSLIAFVGGGIVGLFIAFLRVAPLRILNYSAAAYIQFIQGTPLLMQLFLTFFGLSILGFDVSAWLAASVALIGFTSAFLGEIWRGCIQAIPKTQWEASASLGLGILQQMRYIILPQAVQRTLPPMAGQFISTIKDSAIVSVISIQELTFQGMEIMSATYLTFEIWITVTALYLFLTLALSLGVERFERVMQKSTA